MENSPTPEVRPVEPVVEEDSFKAGEPVIMFDRKHRSMMVFPLPGKRLSTQAGAVDSELLLGQQPGARILTMKGEALHCYRPTLEEYVLLMPRSAAIIPPKDIGYILTMGDVFPGAHVVEAGIGSGALTLSLLRAVGEKGRVSAFELRPDHLNNAVKNIERWPERDLINRLTATKADVIDGLKSLQRVDRVFLDVPEPWPIVSAFTDALKPGGIVVCYLPTMRQVDQLVLTMMDEPRLAYPEVAEVILRPWMADRTRLRPVMRMVGHSGFLVKARRRGPKPPAVESDTTSPATTSTPPSGTTPDPSGNPPPTPA